MNLVHVHLWLNHLPILGTMIALGIFALSLVVDHDEMQQAALGLFAFIALFAIPAYMSGNAAGDVVKNNPDIQMDVVQAHQGSALMAFIFMELTGAAALFGLFRFSRTHKNPWLERQLHTPLGLGDRPFVVGRRPVAGEGLPPRQPDLMLDDTGPFRLSRNHFMIEQRHEGYHVRDLRSTLGTIVNGQPIGDHFCTDDVLL